MPLHSSNIQNLQNYPKINIDRNSVIKPLIANSAAADQFIDKPVATWKKILQDVWIEGIPFILHYISTLKIPANSNIYCVYLIKIIKYLALFMLHIHKVYLHIYGYFYPYSLLSHDALCNEFTRCSQWSEALIRAFAWHPKHDRCAVAICNDYVYVYEGPLRIRVLRHNQQRKVVDLAWQPNNKEVLVVATQTSIILWRVSQNQAHSIQNLKNSNLTTYLAPGLQLIKREKEYQYSNGTKLSETNTSVHTTDKSFKVIENVLPAPIVSIEFDQGSNRLFACSPNSSKIAVLDVETLFNSDLKEKPKIHIEYLRKLGQGITRLLWSPEFNRLATSTTSNYVRIFEPFRWSCKKWTTQENIVQDMIWSRPSGRMLLMANKAESHLYALPFLDNPQANDVGGNKSIMKALDLTAARNEFGDLVGGRVQSFAWDKEGKRLAITFKDNPQNILLYKTVERPTLEFHQLGVIQSDSGSSPLLLQFHDKYNNGALLTVCWSDGNCQHLPLSFTPQEQSKDISIGNESLNKSIDCSVNNTHTPRTPRSLTNFCLVSETSTPSTYPSTLLPINRVQHQTTLFSSLSRSPAK